MSATEWTNSTQFAADLLYYASPSYGTTQTAIFQTGDSSGTSTLTLDFGVESTDTTYLTTLPSLTQTDQTSLYLQISLQQALDAFIAQNPVNTRQILIVFASQDHAQVPCTVNLREKEIFTYTIALGEGWNKYPLICVGSSENNYEGLIPSITDSNDLWNIFEQMEVVTCPHKPLLKLTEIQLDGPGNTGSIVGTQYIEFYNYGHSLSMQEIELGGDFGTGFLTDTTLSQGSYVVIYNTNSEDNDNTGLVLPNSGDCSCNKTADLTDTIWCSDAIYIGCCEGGGCASNKAIESNIASICDISTSLSMTSPFTIALDWTNPSDSNKYSSLESVTYDNSAYWPIVDSTYSLELRNRGWNNQFGSSWVMSCSPVGSPGDMYLSTGSCSSFTPFKCSSSSALCNLNGGWDNTNGTGCIPGSTHLCRCSEGYYPWYHTCYPLPPPTSCVSIFVSDVQTDITFSVPAWDDLTLFGVFACENSVGCLANPYVITPTSNLNPLTADPGREYNSTKIKTSFINNGSAFYSLPVECLLYTNSPTLEPTMSPTFSVASVESCNFTLSKNMRSFEINFEEIQHLNTSSPIQYFEGYNYYFNGFQRLSVAVNCCRIIGSPVGSDPFDIITPDIVSISGDWNNIATDIDYLDEKISRTQCLMKTQQPTKSPTNQPTQSPTNLPSTSPTKQPTKSPTLTELIVPWCKATVLGGLNSLNLTWGDANYGTTTADKSDSYYNIEWTFNDGSFDGTLASGDITETQRILTIPNYSNISRIEMYCTWISNSYLGSRTQCDLFTVSPTTEPTDQPTTDPTVTPTQSPSESPSNVPSHTPTLSPTYSLMNDITWCHAIESVNQFGVKTIAMYWELLLISEPSTPSADVVRYYIRIGDNILNHHTATKDNSINSTEYDGNPGIVGYMETPFEDGAGDSDTAIITVTGEFNGYPGLNTSRLVCSKSTLSPTHEPTVSPTDHPTLSPTWDAVRIYLDNTMCSSSRCGCESDWISRCCYSYCNWDDNPLPVIIVNEKSEDGQVPFYIRRNIETYPYDIQVNYTITAVNQTLADEYGFYSRIQQIESGDVAEYDNSLFNISTTQEIENTENTGFQTSEIFSHINYTIPDDCYWYDFKDEDCKHYIDEQTLSSLPDGDDTGWCEIPSSIGAGPRCDDITPMNGSFYIYKSVENGESNQEENFKFNIQKEGCSSRCDFKGEVFFLNITGCSVIPNTDDDSVVVSNNDILDCYVIYPSGSYIIINNQDQYEVNIEIVTPDDSYEEWLWYVILAAVAILGCLSYVAYRWWVNKKMKEADVAQVEEDLDAVIEDQEKGWIDENDLDEIGANPLANVATNISKPVGTYAANNGEHQNDVMKDIADVRIEKFDEKVEYGQKMGGVDGDYV